MMKQIFLTLTIVGLMLTACGKVSKKTEQQDVALGEETTVALRFVNEYVKRLNDSFENGVPFAPIKWVENSELTTAEFKVEYADLMQEEPIVADYILAAQDYPKKGYKISYYDKKMGIVSMIGVDYPYRLFVQLKMENGQMLIDGCGDVHNVCHTEDNLFVYFAEEVQLPQEYNTFMPEYSTGAESKLLFYTTNKISNFSILDLGEPGFENNKLSYASIIEVYTLDVLSADKPLLVGLSIGESIPSYGISYTDEQGNIKQFTISISGKDGSLILNNRDN